MTTEKQCITPIISGQHAEAAKLTLNEITQQAKEAYQRDDWIEAERLCRLALMEDTENFGALNVLGIVMAQTRREHEAVELLSKALTINPSNALAHCNLGNLLHDLKRHEEALSHYDHALSIDPNLIDALSVKGPILRDLGRFEEALQTSDHMLSLKPDDAELLNSRAITLIALNRHLDALASLDRALAITPDYPDAWNNRGNALRALKRFEDALHSYERALDFNADFLDAQSNRGTSLLDLSRFNEALECFDNVIKTKPDHADAFYNRGLALVNLNRTADALESYEHALRFRPDYVEALGNRGYVLTLLQRYTEALESYDRAIQIAPKNADLWMNRGTALCDLGRHEQALESLHRALEMAPTHANALFNLSIYHLQLGDFARGWIGYEHRWQSEQLSAAKRDLAQPLWLGAESLKGKTILLHAEQGLGDTLQFCRYVKLVNALDADVLLEVQLPLQALLSNLDGVSQVLPNGAHLPPFDYHCPLMSLPLAFKTEIPTIPTGIPYLRGNAEQVSAWQDKLGTKTRPRVGLVWSGNSGHKNDRNRSLTLQQVQPLLCDWAEWVSLQREVRESDAALLALQKDIRHFGAQLKDFSDTAALIELLDMVITVDTSIAHLAGAMGKPVWLLLPFNPDWRWMLDREDSPWYPTARLIRQSDIGDWQGVIDSVRETLAKHRVDICNAALPTRSDGIDKNLPAHAKSVAARKEDAEQPIDAIGSDALPTALPQVTQHAKNAYQLGDWSEAARLSQRILSRDAENFDALYLLGTIKAQTQYFEDAAELLSRAVALKPDSADAHNNLGNALLKLNRAEQALASCGRALELQPDLHEALLNRGQALHDLKRYIEALDSCDRALKIKPDDLTSLNCRGNALRGLNRPIEALASFDRALKLWPGAAEFLNNRGVVLDDLNLSTQALESFEHALRLKPDYPEVRLHLSLCRLRMGHFTLGWAEYEIRWKVGSITTPKRKFAQPKWLGTESLKNKTILLHWEQGLGDTLQFCRYVKLVRALSATVLLEVQSPLQTLLVDLEGASMVVPSGTTLPPFDYHCPLLSLPLAFKTEANSIPTDIPYIYSDTAKVATWQHTLGKKAKPRVGLVWSGNTTHVNDNNRSLTLQQILPLLGDWANWFSLQKEVRTNDAPLLSTQKIIRHFGEQLKDFADTAALVELMDVVVTVDTSVAHLAGAMGKAVWILLPFSPDWRWLLEQDDSPWYPSARLFRQSAPGDWEGVINRVHAELEKQRPALCKSVVTAMSGNIDANTHAQTESLSPLPEIRQVSAFSTPPVCRTKLLLCLAAACIVAFLIFLFH